MAGLACLFWQPIRWHPCWTCQETPDRERDEDEIDASPPGNCLFRSGIDLSSTATMVTHYHTLFRTSCPDSNERQSVLYGKAGKATDSFHEVVARSLGYYRTALLGARFDRLFLS